MSFYEIQYNPNLKIKDPALLANAAVNQLNSTISTPTAVTEITTNVPTTITAEAILSGLIIRTGNVISDTTDNATNIINALRRKYHEIKSNDLVTMPNGTSFTFKFINKTGNTYNLNPGVGLSYDTGSYNLSTGVCRIYGIIVISQIALGDASDLITLANISY